MALNSTGYVSSGAGTAAANGTYTPITGTNALNFGAQQYTNGTDFLAYATTPGAPVWLISATVNPTYQTASLYSVTATAGTTMPLTGWTVTGGVAPAPTFANAPGGAVTPPTATPAIVISTNNGTNQLSVAGPVPTGVTSLNIYRGTTAGGEPATPFASVTVTAGSGAATTYNDNSVTSGTTYYYKVAWANSAGVGPQSAEVLGTATSATPANANGTPSNVVAVTPNQATGNITNLVGFSQNTAALLQWTNPTQIGSAVVQQRPQTLPGTAPAAWVNIVTLPATTTGTPSTVPNFYTVTGLTNGTVYEFDVYGTP